MILAFSLQSRVIGGARTSCSRSTTKVPAFQGWGNKQSATPKQFVYDNTAPSTPAAGPPPQYGKAAGPWQSGAPIEGSSRDGMMDPNLQQWFSSIDTDRSGELDAEELQRALALGNLKFGLTDVDQMVRAFETRGKRTLNLYEFSKLHEFLTSVTRSFQYYDVHKRKSLSAPQIQLALQDAGFNLDQPVLQALLKRFDPHAKGIMELDEYIRMCLFMQSCVRTFTAFDTQRRNKIELDFNQFIYACSHLC